MSYIDGFVIPVPVTRKDEYRAAAGQAWELFREYGALSVTETWADAVPEGEVTSFPRAVQLREGEAVVFSWLEWPDKATRDACMASAATDARWAKLAMPFDGKRLIFGGFVPIFTARA